MPTKPELTRQQQIDALAATAIGQLIMSGCLREDVGKQAFTILQAVLATARLRTDRKPTPSPMLAAQVKAILSQYQRLYLAKYGEEPSVTRATYIEITSLLKQFGPDVVTARLNAFFSWDDPFVEKCGHNLVVFLKQWNRLAADISRRQALHVPPTPADCQHTPKCQSALDHSRKFLAENRPTPLRTT